MSVQTWMDRHSSLGWVEVGRGEDLFSVTSQLELPKKYMEAGNRVKSKDYIFLVHKMFRPT